MSARFGRNQRRRMMSHIAALEEAGAGLATAARFEKGRRIELERRLDEWARRVSRFLGPAHPLNLELKRRTVEQFGRWVQEAIPHNFTLDELQRMGPSIPAEITMQALDLLVARIHAFDDRLRMRAMIELVVEGKVEVAMAVDHRRLLQDERAVEWMAKEVASKFREMLARHHGR